MKEIIIWGIILIIVLFIGESYLKKKYNIRRKENAMSQSVKRAKNILLGILFMIFIVTSSVLVFKYDDINLLFILMPFFFATSLVKVFIQWKYNRSANIWISEIFSVLILIIFVGVVQLFPQLFPGILG